VIIADTTTMVAMSLMDALGLLKRLVGKVTVSPATRDQMERTLRELRPEGEPPGQEFVETAFVDVAAPMLSLEESETLALARAKGVKIVLSDDPVVREEAGKSGLSAIGAVGLLYAAKERGLIDEIRPYVERLRDAGYPMSRQCQDALVEKCGE